MSQNNYYTEETSLYYLKSRYYDPELGRFMTIDDISYIDIETINGLNLYAYCGNNPVIRADENGTAWWHWLIGALVIVATAALTIITAGGFAGAGMAIASVFTATMAPTAVSAVFAGAFVGATIGACVGVVVGGLYSVSQGGSFIEGASLGFMFGAIIGAIVGGACGEAHYGLQAAGKMPIEINIKTLINNPADEFVTIGPKNGAISNYMREISATKRYGQIFASKLQDGLYQIANGHHRVEALKRLGYEFIKIFLVK